LLPEDPQESLKEWITFRCKLWGKVDQFWVQFNIPVSVVDGLTVNASPGICINTHKLIHKIACTLNGFPVSYTNNKRLT
ncbi:hypothetical protein NNA33_20705, partial [Marisediminitalea aggregata]|uniref:hypothetical protein n=1 Tax=Marisediminitalea aggregata TaxID=634436 RepID=UPI0020CBA44D